MTMDAAKLAVTVVAETGPAEKGLQSFSGKMTSLAGSMAATGGMMALGITAPLLAAGKAVFSVGSDFESAFTGVIKTFSGTAAEADVLRQEIRDMAKELPASAVDIATVAEAAGALGIKKDSILGFTRTVIDLGNATDLTADQAATDMARIANIMQMPQDQFDNMGSAIVALGNTGASTESEIVSMAMRIAGAGAVIGLSEAQVLGWSSAMSSMGINAEAGGTAFTRVVVDMSKEVATGGKKLQKFADVAGVSASDFAKAFEEDASAATLMFIEGLGKIEAAGGNTFGVLEDLEFADVRVSDTLLRLSGNTQLVTDSLNTSNTAWEENIALAREAELRYGTTESKVAVMMNRFKDLGITLFDTFKPQINAAIDGISGSILGIGSAISEFAAANPAIVSAGLAFAGVLAAAGPLLLLMSGLAAAIGFLVSPIGLVVVGLAALAAAWAADFGGIQGIVSGVVSAVGETLGSLGNYFSAVVTDGDYLNDWLTHLPGFMQPAVQAIGKVISVLQDFGRYMRLVVTDGDTLNDWLTHLPASLQPAAQAIGQLAVAMGAAFKGDFGPMKASLQGGINAINATIEKFSWSDFVKPLGAWSTYITAIVWPDFVSKMADWSTYISNIIWGAYITSLDWDSWIGDFLWDTYVFSLTWDDFIANLDWTGFITALADWSSWIPTILWETWIAALQWEAYIIQLAWDSFVPVLSDWGAYISTLDWKLIVGTAIDWATWIPALVWNEFVNIIDWVTIIGAFVWSEWISKLTWTDVITALSDWGTWIVSLDWAAFIAGLTDWTVFIATVTWTSFIEKLNWPMFVTQLNWGDYIDHLTWDNTSDFLWGDWIETFAWPAELNVFDWGTYVSVLDWKTIVPAIVDWGTWIPALAWNAFVAFLDWTAFVGSVVWSDWLTQLDWSSYITDFAGWGAWLSTLTWSDFVASTDPGTKVPQLNWLDIIVSLSDWTVYIHNLAWADFVDKITWPTFIKDLQWPTAGEILAAITDAVRSLLPDLGGVAPKTGAEGGVLDKAPSKTGGVGSIKGMVITEGPAIVTELIPAPNLAPLQVTVIPKPWTPSADILREPIPVPIIPTVPANTANISIDPIPVEVTPTLAPIGPMPKMEVEVAPIWGTMADMAANFTDPLMKALDAVKGRFGLQSMIPPEDTAPASATAGPTDFVWPPYPPFEWPPFIWPPFEWSPYPPFEWPPMPLFNWPSMPEFSWPPMPIFSWPTLPVWTWPPIPAPSWLDQLNVPRPSWLGELLTWSPEVRVTTGAGAASGAVPAAAGGAMSTTGGPYLVGEHGREIVLPPKGSRILSNEDSMALAGAGGGGSNISITLNVTANEQQDWQQIINEIAYQVSQTQNRMGRS